MEVIVNTLSKYMELSENYVSVNQRGKVEKKTHSCFFSRKGVHEYSQLYSKDKEHT